MTTMRFRILGLIVGVGALAISGPACEQPQIDCRALHTAFVAKYTLISGDPACSDRIGDVVGLQSYYQPKSDGSGPDRTKAGRLAIRPTEMTDLEGEAGDNGDDTTIVKAELNALGNFKNFEPDETDSCAISDVMTSEIQTNAIPPNGGEDPDTTDDDYPGRAATSIKHEWRNVRLLVTPANAGNLLKAQLTYTKDGCTAQYNVVAMAPVIGCVGDDGLPNDALCDDKADVELGIPFGSGISQDLAPKCDADLGVCVPTKTDLLH
jgi:hypothetical protein